MPLTATPTFVPTPVSGMVSDDASSLESFRAWLMRALGERRFELLEANLTEPFAFGAWRTEWQALTPEEAPTQLEQGFVTGEARVEIQEGRNLVALLDGQDPFQMLGKDVNVVDVLFSRGWGPSLDSEGILYLVQRTVATRGPG